jgi:hypothetical protein
VAVTPRKKGSVAASARVRAKRLPREPVDHALPSNAFPTAQEMDELGRFADRVAKGEERLKYVKL